MSKKNSLCEMTKRPSLESTGALWMANVKEQALMTFPEISFFINFYWINYIKPRNL